MSNLADPSRSNPLNMPHNRALRIRKNRWSNCFWIGWLNSLLRIKCRDELYLVFSN
jgi:hypothetical protein